MTSRQRVVLGTLVFTLAWLSLPGASMLGHARQVRVFPVTTPSALCIVGNSACDLVRAAAGFAPTFGPDAGVVPAPGDELVLAPGIYVLAPFVVGAPANGTGPVVVPGTAVAPFVRVMESLQIRSRSGREVTVIEGAATPFPSVVLAANGVRFGGASPDQGITIQNSGDEGVQIGTPGGGSNPFGLDLSPGTQGSENIQLRHGQIFNSGDDGIDINFNPPSTPKPVTGLVIVGFIIRNSADDGIDVNPLVTALGGAREEEAVLLSDNVFDNNGDDGMDFDHSGPMERVTIQYNVIVRNDEGITFDHAGDQIHVVLHHNRVEANRDDGLHWDNGVMRLDAVSVSYNQVLRNAGFGMIFQNSGDVINLNIVGNRSPDGKRGISSNDAAGILFLNLAAAGGPAATGVRRIENLTLSENVINDNGNVLARFIQTNFGGLPGGVPFFGFLPFDGVTFLNGDDIVGAVIRGNHVFSNAGSGMTVGHPGNATCTTPAPCFPGFAIPGAFRAATIEENVFFQNGTFGNPSAPLFPHGDGLSVYTRDDVYDVALRRNDAIGNFNNGVFLSSTRDGVRHIQFEDGSLKNNGIRLSGFGVAVAGLAGSGALLEGVDGVRDVRWTGGDASDNASVGLALNARLGVLASAAYGAMVPVGTPPADLRDVTVEVGTFHRNGRNTHIGSGHGIVLLGDRVDHLTAIGVEAHRNDDHGLFISSLDEASSVVVSGGAFEGNDLNLDGVGAGVLVDAGGDLVGVTLDDARAHRNRVGVDLRAKGGDGRALLVRAGRFSANVDAGVSVDASEDLVGVRLVSNELLGNGIVLQARERGRQLSVEDNVLRGEGETGTGLRLSVEGVTVLRNVIGHFSTGVLATRSRDIRLAFNNIVNNAAFGLDAMTVRRDRPLDAADNWWGDRAGPRSDGQLDGMGDRVRGAAKVLPFLDEAVVIEGVAQGHDGACDANANDRIDDEEVLLCLSAVDSLDSALDLVGRWVRAR